MGISTIPQPTSNHIIKQGRKHLFNNKSILSTRPRAAMYRTIFFLWVMALMYFQPRLFSLLHMSYSTTSYLTLLSFILFIDLAWLYGIYNLVVIIFGLIYNKLHNKPEDILTELQLMHYPAVAILYTTCNDFLEESVLSCVHQDYPNFKVYILDDSSDEEYKHKIDQFANKYDDRVVVVRRPDRKGFKAGNLNHGLLHAATDEPYFAIADADEILPSNFLKKLISVIESDEKCGFVQANHRSNPQRKSDIANAMGAGIDVHWRYYQPLRNAYGFVMFLGHGAMIRRSCWEDVQGFPDIVSEDLGFAIDIREKGYRGRFVSNVVCYEDFPETVRAFRIRHMKWTRGTCEFLHQRFLPLVKSKKVTWTEKLDILFPTLNLPLTLIYFGFMIVANLFIPYFFGISKDVTLQFGSRVINIPVIVLQAGFESIYTADFFIITLLTFFAPVLCFIIAFARNPVKLIRFISHSTALYAALGPLSSVGVLAYLTSGKAIFLVTGDKNASANNIEKSSSFIKQIGLRWKSFINRSHPDDKIVQTIEIITGLVFAFACIYMMQISFFGLCLAFAFMPLMHHLGWEHILSKIIIHLPFVFIISGILLAGSSLLGMQTIFFGYGFHF